MLSHLKILETDLNKVVEIDYASITIDVSKEAKSIEECFEDGDD